jgi:hypothetical protein
MAGNKLKASLGVLSHPLFLLVVGSIVGSLLIPPVSEKINRQKVLHEARLRKAVEIVDNNTKTVTQLNSMVTRLTSFHDTNIRRQPPPEKLKQLQEKLVEDMDNRWLEFEKTGWWWYQDLNDEAVILGIIPATGTGALRQHVNAYHANILATSNAMKLMWRPCKAADYDYKDPRFIKILEDMNRTLNDLFNERIQLVNNLVSDFTEPAK